MPDELSHVRGWFLKAESDLITAQRMAESAGSYDTACFHAQQAIEKYLKGLLALHGQAFHQTHNDYPGDVAIPPTLAIAPEWRLYAGHKPSCCYLFFRDFLCPSNFLMSLPPASRQSLQKHGDSRVGDDRATFLSSTKGFGDMDAIYRSSTSNNRWSASLAANSEGRRSAPLLGRTRI